MAPLTWTPELLSKIIDFSLVKDLLHFKVDVSRSLIGLLEFNLLFRYSEVQVSLKDKTKDKDKISGLKRVALAKILDHLKTLM